jgi:antitoxin component YwqK of YwqJK toxin-antitoxin module
MKKILILVFVFCCTFASLSLARTEKRYYPDGKLQAVVHYNGQKQKHGVYKVYWLNGKLMEKGVYKNGVIEGTPKKYSIDGIRLQ